MAEQEGKWTENAGLFELMTIICLQELVARFVSMIPFVSDSVVFPGLCDIWSTCDVSFLSLFPPLFCTQLRRATLTHGYFGRIVLSSWSVCKGTPKWWKCLGQETGNDLVPVFAAIPADVARRRGGTRSAAAQLLPAPGQESLAHSGWVLHSMPESSKFCLSSLRKGKKPKLLLKSESCSAAPRSRGVASGCGFHNTSATDTHNCQKQKNCSKCELMCPLFRIGSAGRSYGLRFNPRGCWIVHLERQYWGEVQPDGQLLPSTERRMRRKRW